LAVASLDAAYWHKADMPSASLDGRLLGQRGHGLRMAQCLLLTQSVIGEVEILQRSSRLPYFAACSPFVGLGSVCPNDA